MSHAAQTKTQSDGFIEKLETFARETAGGISFNEPAEYDHTSPEIGRNGRDGFYGSHGHYTSPFTGKSSRQMTHDEGVHEIYGGYVLDRNASIQRIVAQDGSLKDLLNQLFIEKRVVSFSGRYEDDFTGFHSMDDYLCIRDESSEESERALEQRLLRDEQKEKALNTYRPYMETLMTLQDIADGMLHFNRRDAEGKYITHYYEHGHDTVAGSAPYVGFTPPEALTYESIKNLLSYADNVEKRKADGEVIDGTLVQFISEHRQEFTKLQNVLDRNTRIGGIHYSRDDENSPFGIISSANSGTREEAAAYRKKHVTIEPVADSKLLSNAGTPASWYEGTKMRAHSR